MGIYNRDYMQDDGPGVRYRGRSGRDMVVTLIVVNVAAMFLQLVFQPWFTNWLALDVDKVLRGEVWRLFTYDFLHDTDNFWHLFWNMFLLYMAGRKVEAHYGGREFLWFYLIAGWAAGLFFVFWELVVRSRLGFGPASCVGASGAVIAVLIAYVLHWPHDVWRIWGVLPVPVWLLGLIDVATDVFPLAKELGGIRNDDGVAHAAHFGGILFAFVYVRRNWRVVDWFEVLRLGRFRNPLRRRPKFRVLHPEAEPPRERQPVTADISARVDDLLAKIAESGEASLTPAEREFLAEASRRYREGKRG